MIELNGVYKLKKIKGFENNDTSDYKVIAIDKNNKNIVLCERLSGPGAGEKFCFLTNFLIDPEKPEEIYSDVEIVE